MSTPGRGHIFDDLSKLNEMLRDRVNGVGPSELAQKFNCDHSTIIYHCKRNGVQLPGGRGMIVIASGVLMNEVIVREKRARVVISGTSALVRMDVDGDRINPGKSYAEYVQEAQRRNEEEKRMRLLGNTEL